MSSRALVSVKVFRFSTVAGISAIAGKNLRTCRLNPQRYVLPIFFAILHVYPLAALQPRRHSGILRYRKFHFSSVLQAQPQHVIPIIIHLACDNLRRNPYWFRPRQCWRCRLGRWRGVDAVCRIAIVLRRRLMPARYTAAYGPQNVRPELEHGKQQYGNNQQAQQRNFKF